MTANVLRDDAFPAGNTQDFPTWNRQRTREERDSEPHREIDTLLGLTKHRHRDSWPTMAPFQVTQLRYLQWLMGRESFARRGGMAERYMFMCRCDVCGVKIEVRGAVRAYAFTAILHRRHSTFVVWRPWREPEYPRRRSPLMM